jgi:hypothetical protein
MKPYFTGEELSSINFFIRIIKYDKKKKDFSSNSRIYLLMY